MKTRITELEQMICSKILGFVPSDPDVDMPENSDSVIINYEQDGSRVTMRSSDPECICWMLEIFEIEERLDGVPSSLRSKEEDFDDEF